MFANDVPELPDIPAPDETSFARAHRRLLKAFEPLRVFCTWLDAPFGKLFLASTERGTCLLSFRGDEEALLCELERRHLMPEMAGARLDRERREVSEYFEGRRRRFDLPLDLRWGTPFQHQVLEAASRIPFGEVLCYGDVAEKIGRPKASRAVGNALGSNPVPIVIPCHRVVAAGGRLGGYTGGLDIKRTLMTIEGIEVKENRS